jgi:hypothetical protein
MRCRFAVIVPYAVAAVALVNVSPALAVGYWNLPGNVGQWWGYGWGAGHHACFVLGPVSTKGAFAHNHKRLPHAPEPAYGCYEDCTYNYDFRQSSQFVPNEYQPGPQFEMLSPALHSAPPSDALTPDSLPMPEAAAAPEAIFYAPVEQ